MPELGVGGSTRQGRKPDYFIGSSGLPTVTTQSVKMHRWSTASNDGVRNSKLNKCLYNIAVRDGAARGTIDGGSSNLRRSCKTESDITTIKTSTTGRYSKSPSPSTVRGSLSSPAPGCTLRFGNAEPGRTVRSPSGWSSTMTSNSWRSAAGTDGVTSNRSTGPSPPPRLLGTRSGMQRASSTTATTTSSNRSQEGGLMVPQHCRYSNLHKQLDNRLSYQRSYDRNIFGLDQRMDQFVLPPLQI